MKGRGPLMSRRSDDWATPREFVRACEARFGVFDLDAAATPENAVCDTFLTPSDDALTQPWHVPGGRVWLNPPYSQVARFMDKAREEAHACEVVCLVPARTDTQWWHRTTAQADVYLLKGRLRFNDEAGTAPFPSALVVLGPWGHGGRIVNWDWRQWWQARWQEVA